MFLKKFGAYYYMIGGIVAVIIGLAALVVGEIIWGIIALAAGVVGIYFNVRKLKKLKQQGNG